MSHSNDNNDNYNNKLFETERDTHTAGMDRDDTNTWYSHVAMVVLSIGTTR